MNNPLASGRPPASRAPHPMMQHAQMWKHMHGQDEDVLQQHVKTLDYGLPIMGALAANPKVTAKDVIKAVSSAVADSIMAPSQGVAMISSMPADADKLRPWLQERYALNLSAAVHAKAALMSRQQPQAQPPMPQGGPPMAPPGVMPNG